jgi:hypothetical protein
VRKPSSWQDFVTAGKIEKKLELDSPSMGVCFAPSCYCENKFLAME